MEKHRILVVDDEEIIRQLLVRAFGENDYHVEAVENAEAALKRIKEDSFDLFIMDLKMPKIDGMDALKEMKNVNPYILGKLTSEILKERGFRVNPVRNTKAIIGEDKISNGVNIAFDGESALARIKQEPSI